MKIPVYGQNAQNNQPSENMAIILYPMLFLLGLWGCLAIYNSTCYSEQPFHFAGRQFVWLLIGMLLLFLSSKIPFILYKEGIFAIAAISYIPLIAVLAWGTQVNGMNGWFSWNGIFFQPSEFAKAPFLLLLCCVNARIEDEFRRFIALLGVTVLWMIPVALQPDMGTCLVYFCGFFLVYWIGGGRIKYFFFSLAALLPILIFFIMRNPYIFSRFQGFLDPLADPLGKGWHVMQFRYTLARGGFWGASWGKAVWANSYLPLAHSDSAFASLTESVGFAGAFPVIAGIMIICLVACRMADRQTDKLRRTFIFCVPALFALQSLIHISVNLTILPTTGITLPILSYGGSSLVSTMIAFGIFLSAASRKDY